MRRALVVLLEDWGEEEVAARAPPEMGETGVREDSEVMPEGESMPGGAVMEVEEAGWLRGVGEGRRWWWCRWW